jgi:hypothetical protein
MRQYLTQPRILLAAMPVMVAAVGLMTTEVFAGSPPDSGKGLLAPKSVHISSVHAAALHRRHLAQRELHPGPLASSPYGEFTPRIIAFGGARYIYVPKRGILDEACNLPTSTCPNEQRDVGY